MENGKQEKQNFPKRQKLPRAALISMCSHIGGVEDPYFGVTFKDMGATPILPPSYLVEEWERKMMEVHQSFPYHP